ncbi:hypothetical protein LTR10_011608 [Elasticomyces elasticus]|uniref:4-coumarate-CoA ligase n=1 Tax=Exophiala sideris TaxID=1016849 RepID=A0ABR0JDK1_9EURO|nr:hypothetical protein LTR10_011608 [Elasticomyces elasticus]KAK5031933.1 hypothetical protein LTS07_004554 [Exophiala sideris]KAK5040862.1 hypothetical protein LTR13_003163 [Exophiala sideris]KAK5061803.1 hypothetical protein LTR69_004986 [Exophiala sideris]KAK5184503.1 hypothetical protein LTR44_003177 [Eurotiomycetes sp. CCFEE 6388]
MPYNSRWRLSPPDTSIPSFMFGSPTATIDSQKELIVDAKRPDTHYLTLHSYREWAKRLATGLKRAGLTEGDRVMLFSGNSIFNPVIAMAILMSGGIYNSANPAYTPRELAHQLKDADPSFVLAAENCIERAMEAARVVGLDEKRIFLYTDVSPHYEAHIPHPAVQYQHWSTLLAEHDVARGFVWKELHSPDLASRTAILLYSSGTTGLPKGVELSHRSVIANMLQLKQIQLSDTSVAARRSLCVVPLYHALGLMYYSFTAPKCGIQTFLMERYNLSDMLDHIQSFKITELLLVPPILVAMAKHPSVRDGSCDISSVRKVVAGAAPIGMEVTKQFEELFKEKVKVRQAWGMSEAPAITLCWDERESLGPSSISIGELVPGAEAMLVKENGEEETRPGERGEFWVRSPNMMKGYWRNSKATAETITRDGWMKTGDIAYRDEAGKWYMVDRKKELIKVRGAQVAPAELEALLLEHQQILDAAVIGVKTATDDEDPRAYVVLKPGASITAGDVVDYVKERVSKIKWLTGGVAFVDSIPKNPSGKILRRQLRERAAREASGKL